MFLPDILDTGAEGRNRYLTQLSEVAKKLRGKPFSFVWSEGGAQPELEQRLEVTFGYPAFVLLATEKKAFALMRTSWNVDNIVNFVNGVMSGR
jgi:protein disulfide-isomerase A6